MLSSLVSKYTFVIREVDNTISPKRKIFLIIDFFKECENQGVFPPHKTFIYDFTPYLLDIFQSSNINFIDPAHLISAKIVLDLSLDAYEETEGYELIKSQIEKASGYIDLQLIKLYFYLGEVEEGLAVISKMLREIKNEKESGNKIFSPAEGGNKSNTDKFRINPFSLVDPSIYKENRAFEILTEMRKESERINSFTNNELSVLLVENYFKENDILEYYGSVQNLICNIGKKKNSGSSKISFNSKHKDDNSGMSEILDNIYKCSLWVLGKLNIPADFYKCDINIKYENDKYFYTGNSFSLGATVLIICSYLKQREKFIQYHIAGNSAFTGAVDNSGNVLPVSKESIKAKIEAAYFSWIKYCVIPQGNFQEAKMTYETLNKKYPNKEFELIPVNSVEEIFHNPKIIKKENQKITDFTRNKIRKHIIPFSIITSLFLLALSVFFIYEIYPKYIKPLPKTVSDMYLIYAPDRDTNWIFHNNNYLSGDTIDFGDVAIGDQWFPAIEFFNNSNTREKFNIFIDGEDKNDFQITFIRKNEQPEPINFIEKDISQLIYVKFVPVNNSGIKRARLIFEDVYTKSQKIIYLKGYAKSLSNGYCLKIDNCRKLMVLEPGMELLQGNFAITFWFKPGCLEKIINPVSFFNVDNNPLTNNKIALAINPDSTLHLCLYGSKSREIEDVVFITKSKLNFNEWNYVGISILDSTASLILNDKIYSAIIRSNSLRKINDCIYFGNVHPTGRENTNNTTNKIKFLLDDFKIINAEITPEELISNRFQTVKYSGKCIVEYSFDDAMPKRIFDNTTNDYWPNLYGGINRFIDTTQPFHNSLSEKKSIGIGNKVFKRTNKGFLKLNTNIFKPVTSFSLQCDFRTIDDKKTETGKKNFYPVPFFINRSGLDIFYGIRNDSLTFSIMNKYNNFYLEETMNADFISGWNRYTISYDIDLNEICFYLNDKLLKKFKDIEIQNISDNYMGISFSMINYFASPRFSATESRIDNIKLFSRPISVSEIFSDKRDGLLAFWTFEKTLGEIALDEINNIPLLMWGDYEIINENLNEN